MASTLTPIKSFNSTTPLFSMQSVNSNTMAAGPSVDVQTKWAMTAMVRLGRVSSVAVTNATEIRIEGSGRGPSPSNDFWVPVMAWTTALHGTAANHGPLSATAASAQNKIDVVAASVGGLLANDGILFIYNSTTPTNSEWFRILSVASGSIRAFDNLTRSHSLTSSHVTDQAEEWNIPIDLQTQQTIRMIVDNAKNSVAAPVMVEGRAVFMDGILVSP